MTLFDLCQRFVGEVQERPGAQHAPFIQWCHESCGLSPDTPDEVPWCSSWLNRMAWLLRLPRSKSARARSWLDVGLPVHLEEAQAGKNDIVILKRGPAPQGHVGVFAGRSLGGDVFILGGNQGDAVSVRSFSVNDILGVRRLG